MVRRTEWLNLQRVIEHLIARTSSVGCSLEQIRERMRLAKQAVDHWNCDNGPFVYWEERERAAPRIQKPKNKSTKVKRKQK